MLEIENIFDLSKTQHTNLFKRFKYAWEILPYLEDYILATISPQNLSESKGSVYISDNVEIGAGTIIEHGAVIYGPTIIGRNCKIGAGAYIRGGSLIGDDCVVGHATEIKNSILFNQVKAAHFNYIGDSVLGFKVNMGAGSVIANFRLDEKSIIIKQGANKISTNLLKFGAVIGDESSIGCGSVINPGVILGKKSAVYPLISVKGVHGAGSIIK